MDTILQPLTAAPVLAGMHVTADRVFQEFGEIYTEAAYNRPAAPPHHQKQFLEDIFAADFPKVSKKLTEAQTVRLFGQLVAAFTTEIRNRKIALFELGIAAVSENSIHLVAVLNEDDEIVSGELVQAELWVNHHFMHTGLSLELMLFERFEGCEVHRSLIKAQAPHAAERTTS